MAANVKAWFDGLTAAQRQRLETLRQLILDAGPGLVEEIKWGQPCYTGTALVFYLQKAKGHVVLGFQQGAHLEDPDRLLQGAGKDMRHIKFPLDRPIDPGKCRSLVKSALEYDRR